jgi:hypothetical protein
VDEFDDDALVNDFAAGATLRSGGTRPIQVGIADGEIATSAGDLRVVAAGEFFLDDVNQTGSTWAQVNGIKLSETTAEWDAFEAKFGEVSLLNAIEAAGNDRVVARATVTIAAAAGANLSGTTGTPNLDANLVDQTGLSFEADIDYYLNGKILWPSTTGGTKDVNPGTTPANGDILINEKMKVGYVIQSIAWVN